MKIELTKNIEPIKITISSKQIEMLIEKLRLLNENKLSHLHLKNIIISKSDKNSV